MAGAAARDRRCAASPERRRLTVKIAYLFDRPLPATETDSEQAVKTVAALSRLGIEITLVLPRDPSHEPASAEELCRYYQVEGGFAVEHVPTHLVRWQQ